MRWLRGLTPAQLENAEHGAVVESRAGLAQSGILLAGVVDRKTFGRPDHAAVAPGRDETWFFAISSILTTHARWRHGR